MRTQARGLACVIICWYLSACHSGLSDLEAEINKDLQEILSNTTHKNEFAGKLTPKPPESRMLNEAHVQMYVLVKARALQLRTSLNKDPGNVLPVTPEDPAIATEKRRPLAAVADPKPGVEARDDGESEVSLEELTALNELGVGQELYVWAKQTIELTVEFIDAAKDPSVIDIVSVNDPVIEHNISVINNFHERLRFAMKDSLKTSLRLSNINTSHSIPFSGRIV
jgi:hypothetical protein